MVFKGRKDEQILKLLIFTVAVVSLVLGLMGYFLDRYSEYSCGPDEFLALDFECHSEFDAVQVPATASTACGEGQVLTGGNRCVDVTAGPG